MNFLRLLPVTLSLLLMAAHFYRGGLLIPSGICAVLPVVLIFRERWVPPLIRVVLILGAFEWLHALYGFVQTRIALGQPWTRLAIILGAVALLTALSALVFSNRAVKQRYAPDPNYIA
jgi:hypothetical protein